MARVVKEKPKTPLEMVIKISLSVFTLQEDEIIGILEKKGEEEKSFLVVLVSLVSVIYRKFIPNQLEENLCTSYE